MAETKKAKPKKSAKSASAKSASSKGRSQAAKAKEAASSNGGGAAHAIAPIAQKVVLPVIAVGAAAAGAVAVVVSKNGRKRKVLGVSLPKRSKLSLPSGKGIRGDVRKAAGAVTEAAKQADRFGQGVSKVASSVQSVGETTGDAAKKG